MQDIVRGTIDAALATGDLSGQMPAAPEPPMEQPPMEQPPMEQPPMEMM